MATKKNKATTKGNSEVAELCAKLRVERLYINSKGEYFTEKTYAIASEGGDKTKVSCYEANVSDGEDEGGGLPAEGAAENAEKKVAEKTGSKNEVKDAAKGGGEGDKQDNPKENE